MRPDKQVHMFQTGDYIVPSEDDSRFYMSHNGRIGFLVDEQKGYAPLSKDDKLKVARLVASRFFSLVTRELKVNSSGSFSTNVMFKEFHRHVEVSLYGLHDAGTGEMRFAVPPKCYLDDSSGQPIFIMRIVPHETISLSDTE